MDEIQQNIIVGSILSDGSLAHMAGAGMRITGSISQLGYREWKCKMLKDRNLKIRYSEEYPSLVSPSDEYFTKLRNLFYVNNRKTITQTNIKLLNHPIGLACLYMDDGTLVLIPRETQTP